jgi:glucose-1-phosphate thymidylyltransferase
MKGIILAGGSGTRLHPITKILPKVLLPVYNKPMIYYPLSTLMLAGIKDILIISTPKDISKFKDLLGDGNNFGIKLSYKIQPKPEGIAQAFIIGEEFIKNDKVCLILGDNIFYGKDLPKILKKVLVDFEKSNCSTIFGYRVNDPERYGVIQFNNKKDVISIEEKPEKPKSNYAAVGLYFYTNDVIQIAKKLKPSNRGEYEITDVNAHYLKKQKLSVELLDSIFWLDTGTHDALVEASNFIKTVEQRDGKKVSCLEEIAYKYNYINSSKLKKIISEFNNHYGEYLRTILDES